MSTERAPLSMHQCSLWFLVLSNYRLASILLSTSLLMYLPQHPKLSLVTQPCFFKLEGDQQNVSRACHRMPSLQEFIASRICRRKNLLTLSGISKLQGFASTLSLPFLVLISALEGTQAGMTSMREAMPVHIVPLSTFSLFFFAPDCVPIIMVS